MGSRGKNVRVVATLCWVAAALGWLVLIAVLFGEARSNTDDWGTKTAFTAVVIVPVVTGLVGFLLNPSAASITAARQRWLVIASVGVVVAAASFIVARAGTSPWFIAAAGIGAIVVLGLAALAADRIERDRRSSDVPVPGDWWRIPARRLPRAVRTMAIAGAVTAAIVVVTIVVVVAVTGSEPEPVYVVAWTITIALISAAATSTFIMFGWFRLAAEGSGSDDPQRLRRIGRAASSWGSAGPTPEDAPAVARYAAAVWPSNLIAIAGIVCMFAALLLLQISAWMGSGEFSWMIPVLTLVLVLALALGIPWVLRIRARGADAAPVDANHPTPV